MLKESNSLEWALVCVQSSRCCFEVYMAFRLMTNPKQPRAWFREHAKAIFVDLMTGLGFITSGLQIDAADFSLATGHVSPGNICRGHSLQF